MSANSEALPAATPGPWRATKGGTRRGLRNDPEMMDWNCAVYADAPYTENEAGGYAEETEQVVVSARGRTLAEAEANASLSAAAPEMVAELQKARVFVALELKQRGGDAANYAAEVLAGIDSALAKARGGK